MSEFAREAVLGSVEAGGGPKATLGGDLVTLTTRLHELDRLVKTMSGLLTRVLHGEANEEPAERSAGGSAGV